MPKAHVHKASGPLTGIVDPPSSKNFTTRYVIASCLASGHSTVRRPAIQDDAVSLVKCCREMGATIRAIDKSGDEIDFVVENDGKVDRLEIDGFGSNPRLTGTDILNPGNAGAVFRILLAVSALLPEARWETDHHDSLGKRPNLDLIQGLEQLGVQIEYEGEDGRLPMKVRGGKDRIHNHLAKIRRDHKIPADAPIPIEVSGEVSSQFTSALLFLLPLLDESIQLHVTGRLKSLPLIETTRNVLAAAGIFVQSSKERHYHTVQASQQYRAKVWETNGDWPGSSAIFAAAAVVPGSKIGVRYLLQDEQGERECLPFYEKMGCRVWTEDHDGVPVTFLESPKDRSLKSAAVNGDLCTDAVLAMMGAASVADGESRFVQIRVLQFKECDRVREPIGELRKVWETVLPSEDSEWPKPSAQRALWFEPEDDPDTIHVYGAPQGYQGGIEVRGCGDHRVIMLLSIVALRCDQGLTILGAEHVSKSFPGWFDTLRDLGVMVDFPA